MESGQKIARALSDLTLRRAVWLVAALCAAVLVPWLGETLFNTKGEPREAIVAVSMLESGDWILPVSYGADIPYKPPFLAWLIAGFSLLLNGGVVNEFTSRLPSALAAGAMIAAGFGFFARRRGMRFAAVMAAVTLTSFEVLRAAVACRVDMVLTACIVVGLYQMYLLREKFSTLRAVGTVLLLSGAVLTKGPVGALLPCLAMGIFCLIMRDNFFKTAAWLGALCLASMIIPAIWYYAAYARGGEAFLRLAWEENIGRLTGSMSYDSHINPWYYNIITLVAGMLPWTLVWLGSFKSARYTLRGWSRESIFAATVALTVVIFYCIPASKRSVYLLPAYPFIAYGIALILTSPRARLLLRASAWTAAVLAAVAPLCALALQGHTIGHLTLDSVPMWRIPIALLPVAAGIWWMARRKHAQASALTSITLLYLSYNAVFAPMVLNPKSDRDAVPEVMKAAATVGPVYSLIPDTLMRYYTLNFYCGDIIRRGETNTLPSDGGFCILLNPDVPASAPLPAGLRADTLLLTPRSCDTRRPIALLRYPRQ